MLLPKVPHNTAPKLCRQKLKNTLRKPSQSSLSRNELAGQTSFAENAYGPFMWRFGLCCCPNWRSGWNALLGLHYEWFNHLGMRF